MRTNQIILILFLYGFLAALAFWVVPIGYDFETYFLPAGRAILSGVSPYHVKGFYNPPWLALIFVPLSVLPARLAWGLFFSIILITYIIALQRLEVTKFPLFMIMLSPYTFYSLWYGNIDSFVLLGATLPPAIGVWLVLLKPQMSIGLLVLWLYQVYPSGMEKDAA